MNKRKMSQGALDWPGLFVKHKNKPAALDGEVQVPPFGAQNGTTGQADDDEPESPTAGARRRPLNQPRRDPQLTARHDRLTINPDRGRREEQVRPAIKR